MVYEEWLPFLRDRSRMPKMSLKQMSRGCEFSSADSLIAYSAVIQIKEEAARRKALRDANAMKKRAEEEANRVRTAEEIQIDMQRSAHQEAVRAAALKAQQEAEEKRLRAERKKANDAKWGGGLPPATPSHLAALKKVDK
jgi:multidrug resistance efflux pump